MLYDGRRLAVNNGHFRRVSMCVGSDVMRLDDSIISSVLDGDMCVPVF